MGARSSRPLRIVYIAGSGRSGSTLLGRVLGQIEGCAFLGELRHFWTSGVASLSSAELCGCGLPFSECELWGGVHRSIGDLPDLDEVRLLKRSVDRSRYIPGMLGWPATTAFKTRLALYLGLTRQLYEAVAEVSEAEVLIDGSKDPSSLFLLSCFDDVEVTVAHLVRDVRGVAFSWKRKVVRAEFPEQNVLMSTESVGRSAAFWDFTNLLAESARRRHRGYLRIRYEDMVEKPKAVIGDLCRVARIEDANLSFLEGRSADLNRATHSILGNPSRFVAGRTRLRLDEEWRTGLRGMPRVWATLLGFPLLLRYGYLGR